MEMRMKLLLLTCIALSAAFPLSAQRMDVKRHLGYDFSNQVEEILNYYSGLGVRVERDEIRTENVQTEQEETCRLVAFNKTPSFLSAATSFIHIGVINGEIQIISIATDDIFGSELMDRKLHRFSGGNVSVRRTEGPKEIIWQFENCKIVKRVVARKDDSARYMKYDIIPTM